ncbi:membrane protein US16 [Panine betaherpesvirus 2]|uniref:Membrane protein US16 n=1 Tax=Panine betaherpesvirus 2 TaxID=188763 RepID=Q8QRU3_9BETA|nr:membrane protein US16 [Panine betaherpesvirus 2]AAM00795.1 membrane protein US16 [Panine betaherpesvirus 2]QXV67913.1 membrane protein US16 [Panine betaherpesvirus 2]
MRSLRFPGVGAPAYRRLLLSPSSESDEEQERYEASLAAALCWLERFEVLSRVVGLLLFQIAFAVSALGGFALVFPAKVLRAYPGFPCGVPWTPEAALLLCLASACWIYWRYERPLSRHHPRQRRPLHELALLLGGLLVHLPLVGLVCVCQEDPAPVLSAFVLALVVTFLCAQVAFLCRGLRAALNQFMLINTVWFAVFLVDLLIVFTRDWPWALRLLVGFYTTMGIIFAGHLSQQVLMVRYLTMPRDAGWTSVQMFSSVVFIFFILLRVRTCTDLIQSLLSLPSFSSGSSLPVMVTFAPFSGNASSGSLLPLSISL